ncbi:hypothetical protein [Terracoccus sp. 273MFTsu3.1]|uniref:hypothetical protein n=1 Tax=Terracoccus sp. 273MFTsu3.1 TaxID=1172188 RepID=UPI000367DEB2|nr:hypothetical protein [Terracoccus sp. 273MFTsu3.1]
MAGNPGLHVTVTRTVTYTYVEPFVDEDSIHDLEATLTETVRFRDPQYCDAYDTTTSVLVTEATQ